MVIKLMIQIIMRLNHSIHHYRAVKQEKNIIKIIKIIKKLIKKLENILANKVVVS